MSIQMLNLYASLRRECYSDCRKIRGSVIAEDRHHHHHHEQAPGWSVAVSTRCFQCSRSWVYFHAELRPRLRGCRSASRMRSQVWRGRPGSRLQSLGSPRIETLSALVMSSDVSILATCPKKPKPPGLHELWTGLKSYRGVGYMVRVWNAEDTAQTHIVKSNHLFLRGSGTEGCTI